MESPNEKSKQITKLIKQVNKGQYFEDVNNPVFMRLESDLKKIKNANTICSFDMEFANRDGKKVVEIGVAIYDRATKETYSEHFIIEDEIGKYKRNHTPMEHVLMFAHGKSKKVSLESAMKALNNFMNNSDVNIIYAQENKHEHMIKHNFKNDKFINVQDLMRLNSSNGLKMSLTNAVEEFGGLEQPAKNAGNDAAVTLEILSNIFGDKIDLKNYESPVVNDFSQHPKKMNGSKIKELRNLSPNQMTNDKYTAEQISQTRKVKL
jgi:hypothetical protein